MNKQQLLSVHRGMDKIGEKAFTLCYCLASFVMLRPSELLGQEDKVRELIVVVDATIKEMQEISQSLKTVFHIQETTK